ncbi:MAG: glycosyltransferase family A protein [Betaproteobacteria bacterium]
MRPAELPAPEVSIVIPAFNAGRHLAETVQSALAQSFTSCEIIVIDDGSSDDTPAILHALGGQVRSERQQNSGASSARNRGTELSRGRFIQYLDADDLLLPDAVGRRVAALEAAAADVAYSDWQRIEEQADGSFLPGEVVARSIQDVHEDAEIATFTSFWAPPAALLYRRRIVDRIGGWNESLPIIQDARFLQDAAIAGAAFVHVPGLGARYRVTRERSLSRRSHVEFARDVLRNAQDIQRVWEARGPLGSSRQAALGQVFDYVCRELLESDRQAFDAALSALYRVRPGFSLQWPKIAGLAAAALGQRRAADLMTLLRRPPASRRALLEVTSREPAR